MNFKVPLFVLLASTFAMVGCGESDPNSSDPISKTRPAFDDEPPAASKISAQDYDAAFQFRSQAIGLLENKEWAKAIEQFDQVSKLLPESTTTARNLALAHVLSIVDDSTDYKRSGTAAQKQEYRNAVIQAREAVSAFRGLAKSSFDKALADRLEGELLVFDDSVESGGFEKGLSLLRQAADAVPNEADFRYAVAAAMEGRREYATGDASQVKDLEDELQKTLKLAPQNLFALQRLLKHQALMIRTQQSVDLVTTLQKAKDLLKPLTQSLQAKHNRDINDMIDQALAAENQMARMGPAMVISNLILPELATKIDQRRLDRNLLEYLELAFSDAYVDFRVAERPTETLPKTVLTEWKAASAFSSFGNVTDLQLRDFNLDGVDDLLVAREGRFEVYQRDEDDNGTGGWTLLVQSPDDLSVPIERFITADLDRDADRRITGPSSAIILQDADGDRRLPKDDSDVPRFYDTDLDVIGFGPQGACLIQNAVTGEEQRQLVEWPSNFGLKDVHTAAVADLDADGDLDLAFGTESGFQLFRCLKTGMFESLDESIAGPDFPIVSIQPADWDFNVAIDLAATSEDGRSGYLENMLHGRFRWQDLTQKNKLQNSTFVLQPNRNGSWEMVSPGQFDQTQQGDLDNDGFVDLLTLSEGKLAWYRGLPEGGFSKEPASPAFPSESSYVTFTVADGDADGDQDVFAVTADSGNVQQIENIGGSQNNWITVVTRAVYDDPQNDSSRVNMLGIGSVLELWHEGHRQRRMITQPRTHLGLGKASHADLVRVIWTDGIPQNVVKKEALKGRIAIQTPQILKSSCPYIYTWDGEKFVFFSDCLWAAPLGLVGADGTLAPTREWEHLLIPGDILREKDGQYVLQLTEELWEIAYFDQVELVAVDHPADVSVFTNEKVGPASLANHQIHTAKTKRQFQSVTAGTGDDLTDGLKDQDKDYVQPFGSRQLQGLTEEWTMEFTPGDLRKQAEGKIESFKLFLTGWVFPTDTSLNLAIHQNPELQPPMPPVVEILNEQGTWEVARPFIGFPSGKTKAMVIDLSDIFPAEATDFRFRLRSTMELYFDEAFYTLNEPESPTVTQPCPLASADLHYRGFSRRRYSDRALFRNGYGPEDYDYQSVTKEARWPTIHGRFTRFGDVTPLLTDHDDHMVVMGPGEEATIRFDTPKTPVPDGWKRDFVLRNVGFDKDADLNTIYGQTTDPLPFRGMSRYPIGLENAPDSPEYRTYLQTWQTRELNPVRFREAGAAIAR